MPCHIIGVHEDTNEVPNDNPRVVISYDVRNDTGAQFERISERDVHETVEQADHAWLIKMFVAS